ncbi:VaFE repeat-containing surface-anchored protein, partial [uncultured Parvimonas sp.]|uniref:VaFE repeat-containing surface-anchored protein n=1 Tax=uncultured Parvimonas sp. TaxID=747372 RepID=UPI0028D2FE33
MKQRSKSFLVFFLILSMVLQTIGASFVHAAGEVKPNVKVTRFNIYKHKHKEGDSPLTKLYSTDQFDLELDWDATMYGNNLKQGDYFEVQLPTEMQFPLSGSATQFDLVDTKGTVVAKGKINAVNGGGGKIVVTFTKSVENLYNVKGTMKLEASFVRSKIKVDSDNTFTISVHGKPITHKIHVDKPGSVEGEDLAKYAYDPDNAEQKVQWVVRINLSKNLNMQHTFVSDELSPAGAKYLDGTIILREVEFDNTGTVKKIIKEYSQAELNSMIKFNGDKSSFTLNIGSPGKKSFQLRYQTTYPDDKIVNKVILKGDGIHKEYHGGFNSASSSGTGEGNKGKVKIVKVDAIDPNIKLPQAKFEIRVKDTDELIETMVTGDNGEAISKTTLNPIKKYVLKEISTPPGYQVESTSENLEFKPDLNKLTTVAVKNKRILTNICGRKTWVNDDGYNVRPSQITIQLVADGKDVPGKTQIVKPDQNGDWKYEFKDLPKYRTDKRDANGDDIPIVYTVKEVKVPEGYTSEVSGMNVKNTFTPKEYDFKFRKTDVAGKELAGAKIKLSSDDGRATIKENGVKVPSVEWISDGTAKQLTLEPGNYTFVETAAPEGFSLATTIKFTVNKDGSVSGTTVKVDGSTTIISMVDDYKYHPVTVSKVDLGGTELPGAKITVKSADGTNLISDNGKSVNSVSWESTNTAKELKLRAGKYVFHEEAAPEGYLTVTDIEFEVDKDGNVKVTKVAEDDIVKSEGGKITITDRKEISIKTEAKVNGEKEVKAKGQLTLTDKVSYKNLIVGKTYTVNLVWMDKETNQPFLAEGNPIKAETTFVAQQADGEVELNVTVDSNYFTKETKLVAFEEMFQNGVKVAAHEDINDVDQSVVVRENFNPVKVSKVDLGGTELAGAKITVKSADGTNLINDNGTKVNTISWESTDTAKELNLLPGKYVFHEEAAPEGYLTVTDIEFEVDKDGNVKVTKVAEDDIVKSEGGKVTITDRKKPTVETEAKVNGEKEDAPTDKVVLTDVVKYKNLIVGKKYTAKLVWMDKETGKPFLVDGKEVTAEKEFVAEQENGEVELSVTVDAKHFEKDTQLVAFEEVYKDNVLVAAHKDINDENQTVKVKQPKPDLKTEAKVNGEKEVKAKDELTLTDKVSYKNLVIGKEYTVKLVWMDKETGKPFLADGKELTAEKTFVAEASEGEIELSVNVDSKYFEKDTTLVAFEKLFENNVEIGAHEDINDVDQSVVVRENFNPVKVSKVDLGGT